MSDTAWWPVTVTWLDDRIDDVVHATTRKEAEEAAADNWPGAEVRVH